MGVSTAVTASFVVSLLTCLHGPAGPLQVLKNNINNVSFVMCLCSCQQSVDASRSF